MHKKKNQQLKDQKIKKRYNRVQFELFYLQQKKKKKKKKDMKNTHPLSIQILLYRVSL